MAVLVASTTSKIVWGVIIAAVGLLVLVPLVRGGIRLVRDDEPPVPSSWGKQLGRHKDDDEL